MTPILNLYGLAREGASIRDNLVAGLFITVIAWGLIELTGKCPVGSVRHGVYGLFLGTVPKARDPVTYHMIFQSKAMIYTMLAFPTISFVSYGVGYWTAPLLMRLHDVSATEVGMYIGLGNALGGLLGVTLGGIFGDKFKQRHPA